MKSVASLAELRSVTPGYRTKKDETLEECAKDTELQIKSVLEQLDAIQGILNRYPEIKNEDADNYWMKPTKNACSDFCVCNGVWYFLPYNWITYSMIEKTMKSLKVKDLQSTYISMLGEHGKIMKDDADEYSKKYRLNLLMKKAAAIYGDLTILKDRLYDKHRGK